MDTYVKNDVQEGKTRVKDQVCSACKFIQTSIRMPRGSEQKELIVKCQKGYALIWLFSGETCQDYQARLLEKESKR